ncbi:unnamed protein product [marine sediment metagenome]|uniref:Uncharacterized protein n=1 Tax=marine sediment metagenome TaxID=412755 RepID=X0YXU7_9ZZZZ
MSPIDWVKVCLLGESFQALVPLWPAATAMQWRPETLGLTRVRKRPKLYEGGGARLKGVPS